MINSYQYLDIDINKKTYKRLRAVQGDSKSRYILASLYDNSKAYNLSNCSVKVFGCKSDKKIFFNYATVTDATNGKFKIELTNQALAVAGELQIQILILGSNQERLTSFVFYIDIEKSIVSDDVIESTNEFRALTGALSQVEEWNGYFEETSGKIEEKYTERLSYNEEKISVLDENLKINMSKTDTLFSQVNNEGLYSSVFLPNQDFESNYFRIPFMTVTKRGTIVAGCDVRYNSMSDQSLISLGTARSIDGGKTWIDKTIAMENSGQSDVSRCMDGTILYDEVNDRLWLLGNYWHSGANNWTLSNTHKDSDWDIKVCYSDDDGRTWKGHKSLRDLCPQGYSQFIGGVGSGIQMDNGYLVFPIQISPIGERQSYYTESGLIYSTDGGANWDISSSFVPGYASECSIVEYWGKLLINCRQENSKFRKVYYTTNLGATWNYDKLSKGAKQGSVCQGSTIKIPYDGGSILFSSPDGEGRTALNLKVMTNTEDSFEGVTTIVGGWTQGYSCLGYDKINNKLYVVYESNGLQFHDLTYALKDIKKSKSITQPISKNNYHDFLSVYISSNGDDNNSGLSKMAPVRNFKRVEEIAKNYCYGRIDIYIDHNYNEVFKIYNIQGDIRIKTIENNQVLNLKQLYIRTISNLSFECDVNIIEPFSSEYAIAVDRSNVLFKNLVCNVDVALAFILNISSNVVVNNTFTTNKTALSLIGSKQDGSTTIGVNLSQNIILGNVDNSNNSIIVLENVDGLPVQSGTCRAIGTSFIAGKIGTKVTYNRILKPTFNNNKISDRNGECKLTLLDSFIHYTLSLNVNGSVFSSETIFTIPTLLCPQNYKFIPLTCYGSGGVLLGTIQARVNDSGYVNLVGTMPSGTVEIYSSGSYFFI